MNGSLIHPNDRHQCCMIYECEELAGNQKLLDAVLEAKAGRPCIVLCRDKDVDL